METIVIFTLAVISASLTLVLTGAMTGLFWAFSVAVMPGLDGIAAGQAISAMQSFNQKIQNPVFFAIFIGALFAAPVTGVLLLMLGQRPAAMLFFAAAAVYIVGAFVLTAAVNVPMNNALDAVVLPVGLDEAARLWSDYSARWTRWNTVRAVASGASLLIAGAGVFLWGGQA
jgi:uncharacterized membrane protein